MYEMKVYIKVNTEARIFVIFRVFEGKVYSALIIDAGKYQTEIQHSIKTFPGIF